MLNHFKQQPHHPVPSRTKVLYTQYKEVLDFYNNPEKSQVRCQQIKKSPLENFLNIDNASLHSEEYASDNFAKYNSVFQN